MLFSPFEKKHKKSKIGRKFSTLYINSVYRKERQTEQEFGRGYGQS
jgi:hypothetical protein